MSKKPTTKAEIQQVVEVVNRQEEKKQNFFRELISDNNRINEASLIGTICFAIFIIVVIADVFFPALNVEKSLISHLVLLITGCFGIGAAKSYREIAKKTVIFEKPE